MQALLETLYTLELHSNNFIPRKIVLDFQSYIIKGVSQSGKTMLVKQYLSSLSENYLYIDCHDIRIDTLQLNETLQQFCDENKIKTLVLNHYNKNIKVPDIQQVILCTEESIHHILEKHLVDNYIQLNLYPLDFEEFLAYEHKFDSTALNHFFQLGGFPKMHQLQSDERTLYLQSILKNAFTALEFSIFQHAIIHQTTKLSAFSLYERLKQNMKISKDKTYETLNHLVDRSYLYQLEKYLHPRATKKIYICDTALKDAFTTSKNFVRLFENSIFLELVKMKFTSYYHDDIDFYLPEHNKIIFCMPFSDERALFKKLEKIEAFIFQYQVENIVAITMNHEAQLSHPFANVEMLPFSTWAILE
jgi:predicted AAA+ superfamily ATPase